MYLETAILALVLGLITRGSLKKLFEFKVYALPLLIVSALFCLLPQVPGMGAFLVKLGTPAAVLVAIFRYAPLIAFALANYRNIPICIIGAGGLSNFLATLANGGRMPVSTAALGVKTTDAAVALLKGGMIFNYRVEDAQTRLRPLCDIIQARGIYLYFLSVGDILISIGIFALIIKLMEPRVLIRAYAGFRALPVFKRR